MVIAVWITSGMLSLAGALTYAELSAMFPEAGGEYIFIREGYGPRMGFVYGWTQFMISYTASQAAKGAAFAVFLNVLMGGTLNLEYAHLNLLGHVLTFGRMQVISLAIVGIVTLVNFSAVSVTGKVAAFLTALKVVLILGVGIGTFLFAKGSWAHLMMNGSGGTCEGVAAGARGGIAGFGAAMLGALWAYDGWSNLTIVAGEVKNPQRNLPFALIGGMSLIVGLYCLVNLAYFYSMTPLEIASVPAVSAVATEVIARIVGPLAASLMAAALLTSTLGSLYTGILTGARIPYAMAEDGLFFRGLAQVSSRTHIPRNALILQAIWIFVLVLTGSFDSLTDYAMFASWIFYGLATGSLFIFRRKLPNADRPYRVLGYPVVPIIVLVLASFLIINTIWTAPLRSVIGLGFIAIGLPFYYYWSRKRRDLPA
ncbi:MAG TPA: amino acid permease, partial [Acidobacteriota bacterium]|nr:amino acid permease [Acidobacteriota bacterium]